MSCSRTQGSDAAEAQTRGPSVWSQGFYHWATALPITPVTMRLFIVIMLLQVAGNTGFLISYHVKGLGASCQFECQMLDAPLSAGLFKKWIQFLECSWNHKFFGSSGLLQSKWKLKGFTLTLQEARSIHDSMNIHCLYLHFIINIWNMKNIFNLGIKIVLYLRYNRTTSLVRV